MVGGALGGADEDCEATQGLAADGAGSLLGAEEERADQAGAQAIGGAGMTQVLARANVIELARPDGAPGQLALGLTAPQGPNLSAEDRAEAERRYRVIEPLVTPERFRGLWAQAKGRRGALIALLAREHKTAARTIYHWLKAFDGGGLPALVTRDRSDRGKPRVMTSAALDFLLAAALPKPGVYGEMSVQEIWRAYEEERARRAAHDEGKAALPAVSYRTMATWYGRIPEVVRVMGREGQEAFSNSQEVISFRDLSAIQPLEYVVMDHRRLDVFCLVRNGQRWKATRPWLTAALEMRTRKWLAWAIVEQPSSDSIATVLKRVFLRHGLPGAVYWDNGKDFCCEWLEGRQAKSLFHKMAPLEEGMRGVLETLGVRVHHAIVKRARAKIIEPNFLNTALYDKTLPWWCGHTPSDRPERFGVLVEQHERWPKGEEAERGFPTIEQVAALYEDFLESLNEREHSGEEMRKITPTGRGWASPNEMWETLIPKVARRAAREERAPVEVAEIEAVSIGPGASQDDEFQFFQGVECERTGGTAPGGAAPIFAEPA